MVFTVTGDPSNAPTVAVRRLCSMQLPVAVPRKGSPLSTARVTRVVGVVRSAAPRRIAVRASRGINGAFDGV